MRFWVLLLLAILLGLGIGLGMTVMELGASPTSTVDAILLASANRIPANGPHVATDGDDYDFGGMERNSEKSHTFTVRNTGQAPLTLKKGETTCRCTKFEIGDTKLTTDEVKTLAPGESTTVELEWHATVPPGEFRQSATVETNDLARPLLRFTVFGQVTTAYAAVPDGVVFSSISASEPHSAVVHIISYRPGPVKFDNTEFTDSKLGEFFAVHAEPLPSDLVHSTKDAQSGALLTLTLKPGLPLGAFHLGMRVHISGEENTEIDIPIEGTIVSDVMIVGRGWNAEKGMLSFGTLSSHEGAKAELFLLAHGGAKQKLHPTVQKISPDTIKVSFEAPSESADGPLRIPLTVEIPRGLKPALHLGDKEGDLGEILIDTGVPEAKTLKMTVRFAIGE